MKSALILSPHPDDEAIGCGGAICAHRKAREPVSVIHLTSGEQGGHGRLPDETARLREREARRAATILGVGRIEFWRQPDGRLRVTPALTARLVSRLRADPPHWLYAPHPTEMHPDHRAAARLARAAVRRVPRRIRPEIVFYEVWTPLQRFDHAVDITAYVRKKRAAIRAHRSQRSVLYFDDAILGLNRYRGEMHCWFSDGTFAEVFAVARL